MTEKSSAPRFLAIIGPGILVAATGVGAGDLATASLAGANLGVAVLWAVLIAAFLKFVLTEGLMRWQLATGDTLLEGCVTHLGLPFQIVFLLYLFSWSLFVGAALMGACGVAAHAIIPVLSEASTGKLWFGICHSLLGVVLVRIGGFRLFEKIMGFCIGIMFVTVLLSVVLIRPDWTAIARGAFIPSIPKLDANGLEWTVALIGGVGGTLTVLCYGYWIREKGRVGGEALRVCRIDLAVGYAMTALFGAAMVIIGSQTRVEGSGAGLVVALAQRLEEPLGSLGKWTFLLGAWGAVFSSLLGVWQSVPYIFADFLSLCIGESREDRAKRVATHSATYRGYLLAIAVVPVLLLRFEFQSVQKLYAVFGACFIPFLAVSLIRLNGPERWVGRRFKNRPVTNLVLGATVAVFLLALYYTARKSFD